MSHPNRNWRKQWTVDGARAVHASGVVVELVRHADGSLDVQTVDGTLPTFAVASPEDVLVYRRHVGRLIEEAVVLLSAPKLP